MELMQAFLDRLRGKGFTYWFSVTIISLFLTAVGVSQEQEPPAPAPDPMGQMTNKYPGLMAEFGQILQRVQKEVPTPSARTSSRLLPLLPKSTVFYVALPNYGDASNKVLQIFREELEHSPDLKAWWHEDEMKKQGPDLENALQKFYQLSQYLGDEVVLSGAEFDAKEPKMLVIAEVHKPGLKEFLREMVNQFPAKSRPKVQIVGVEELASAKDTAKDGTYILVRPELVALGSDLTTLRNFNRQVESKAAEFPATEFGQRVAHTYDNGGASAMAGVDVRSVFATMTADARQNPAFKRSGFDDAKYLVWTHQGTAEEESSQFELSFGGPRRGAAAWLASPASMNSLDFVSSKPAFVISLLLKDPAVILEDIRELATASNPNGFASIDQMESQLQISLRDDLLRYLGGELTLEVSVPSQKEATWNAILSVKDATRVQDTLDKLLTRTRMNTRQFDEDGVTYHAIRIPSPQKTMEINYTFVDGYLLIASSHEKIQDALRLHHSGGSLAKSAKFKATIPRGSPQFSAVFYQDPLAMTAFSMARFMPGWKPTPEQAAASSPVVMYGYGDDNALREVSRSTGTDPAMIMMTAAIAIPNLLRARMAANEASGASNIRVITTAQLMYSTAYPQKGYARSLATLGPDPHNPAPTSLHAHVIDDTLGNSNCTAGVWCAKAGYKFLIKTACVNLQPCRQYVAIGTPENATSGSKNFCSTSDTIVRYQIGPPMTVPITAKECNTWIPVQ